MREILEFTAHWQKEALYLLHVDGLYCQEKLVHSQQPTWSCYGICPFRSAFGAPTWWVHIWSSQYWLFLNIEWRHSFILAEKKRPTCKLKIVVYHVVIHRLTHTFHSCMSTAVVAWPMLNSRGWGCYWWAQKMYMPTTTYAGSSTEVGNHPLWLLSPYHII